MIYFFDGSKEGFLTAFCIAYNDKNAILTSTHTQLSLGQETQFITANPTISKRAERRFDGIDEKCMEELFLLLRSGQNGKDSVAFEYMKLIAQKQRSVREMLAIPIVHTATEYLRRIRYEIHRMHGFVRFMESDSGALYAPISPDNDICDLIAPHFQQRLPHFPFVIHDVTRKKATIYDGKSLFVAPLERAEVMLSAKENEWQSLWKEYYQSVNIPSRKRLKQMRDYLPVRYWKYMPEFQ